MYVETQEEAQMDVMLYSVVEAASYLGIKRSTFYGLMSQGQIRSVYIGRRRLVPRGELDSFIERQLEAFPEDGRNGQTNANAG